MSLYSTALKLAVPLVGLVSFVTSNSTITNSLSTREAVVPKHRTRMDPPEITSFSLTGECADTVWASKPFIYHGYSWTFDGDDTGWDWEIRGSYNSTPTPSYFLGSGSGVTYWYDGGFDLNPGTEYWYFFIRYVQTGDSTAWYSLAQNPYPIADPEYEMFEECPLVYGDGFARLSKAGWVGSPAGDGKLYRLMDPKVLFNGRARHALAHH